jgi:predicted nucleic acid-binding protein
VATALYLDSSAIVKFYVHEPHYQNVRQWAESADILATSEIAYTEVVSAFSQKVRSEEIGWDYVSQVLPKLNQLWFGRLAVVRIDPLEAAQYVLSPTFPLRAMDSVHLHAAIAFRSQMPEYSVMFCSFDRRLIQAANTYGFRVLDEDAAKRGEPLKV